MEVIDKREFTEYGTIETHDCGEPFFIYAEDGFEEGLVWIRVDFPSENKDKVWIACLNEGEMQHISIKQKVIPINAKVVIEDEE